MLLVFCVILDQSLDYSAKLNKICIKYNSLRFSNLYNYKWTGKNRVTVYLTYIYFSTTFLFIWVIFA